MKANQPKKFQLEVEDVGNITILNFTDKIINDEQSIYAIGQQLFSLVDDFGKRKIVFNLRNVEYLSSFAFEKFITLNKKLKNNGGHTLTMCHVHPNIYEYLERTKLNKLFNIQSNEQSAIQSLENP